MEEKIYRVVRSSYSANNVKLWIIYCNELSQIDLFFDNRIDITDQVIFDLDDLYKNDPEYLEFIIGK